MTPDKMRLSGLTNNAKSEYSDSFIGGHKKQILLTPEEAAVMIHGEIETVRDGNVTHQAIQTNLADVICGGKYARAVCDLVVCRVISFNYRTKLVVRTRSLRFLQIILGVRPSPVLCKRSQIIDKDSPQSLRTPLSSRRVTIVPKSERSTNRRRCSFDNLERNISNILIIRYTMS